MTSQFFTFSIHMITKSRKSNTHGLILLHLCYNRILGTVWEHDNRRLQAKKKSAIWISGCEKTSDDAYAFSWTTAASTCATTIHCTMYVRPPFPLPGNPCIHFNNLGPHNVAVFTEIKLYCT